MGLGDILLQARINRIGRRIEYLHAKQKFARKHLAEAREKHRARALADDAFERERARWETQLSTLTREVSELAALEKLLRARLAAA